MLGQATEFPLATGQVEMKGPTMSRFFIFGPTENEFSYGPSMREDLFHLNLYKFRVRLY